MSKNVATIVHMAIEGFRDLPFHVLRAVVPPTARYSRAAATRS